MQRRSLTILVALAMFLVACAAPAAPAPTAAPAAKPTTAPAAAATTAEYFGVFMQLKIRNIFKETTMVICLASPGWLGGQTVVAAKSKPEAPVTVAAT